MKGLRNFFSFKTVYSENKTYIIYSIGKKEEINYTQVQMLETAAFREYFVPFQCTKTASVNKISFDVSGLTALSEYIKTDLTQEKYFEIVSGIQQIASFCQKSYLSLDNLVCSLQYMYYHNVQKKVLMAYVPVKNPHYVCDGLGECLIRMHKQAKNLIITDGNYMQKYEAFLQRYIAAGRGKKKKDGQAFSADALLHFFYSEQMNTAGAEDAALRQENLMRGMENNAQNPQNFSIIGQVQPVPESVPAPAPNPVPAPVPQPLPAVPESPRQEEPPFVPAADVPQTPKTVSETVIRKRTRASLTDKYGNLFYISQPVYRIGRNADNDLVISERTVSGSHAVIRCENDEYFITDTSSNGTYLNEESSPVSNAKLKDGDWIFFDEFCYVFHIESRQEEPKLSESAGRGTATVKVSKKRRTERPVAYLKRLSDEKIINIFSFPFRSEEVSGIVLTSSNSGDRTEFFVARETCESLYFESVSIPTGQQLKLFSGCTLTVDDERFSFHIEG